MGILLSFIIGHLISYLTAWSWLLDFISQFHWACIAIANEFFQKISGTYTITQLPYSYIYSGALKAGNKSYVVPQKNTGWDIGWDAGFTARSTELQSVCRNSVNRPTVCPIAKLRQIKSETLLDMSRHHMKSHHAPYILVSPASAVKANMMGLANNPCTNEGWEMLRAILTLRGIL